MIDSRHSGLPPPLIVSALDAARLEALLESPRWRDQPAALALQEELLRAEVRAPDAMPADVVGMHSVAECEDEDSGERRRLTVVYPHEADVDAGRVSVLAPVGSALIGLSVGQHIDWEMPGGRILHLRVTAVEPHATGNAPG